MWNKLFLFICLSPREKKVKLQIPTSGKEPEGLSQTGLLKNPPQSGSCVWCWLGRTGKRHWRGGEEVRWGGRHVQGEDSLHVVELRYQLVLEQVDTQSCPRGWWWSSVRAKLLPPLGTGVNQGKVTLWAFSRWHSHHPKGKSAWALKRVSRWRITGPTAGIT